MSPNLLSEIKALAPDIPAVLASQFKNAAVPKGVYSVDSHRPPELISIFSQLFDGGGPAGAEPRLNPDPHTAGAFV